MLAGLTLLAACANLGSLFAARAADRSREVALRLALGSSRQRILRGLFTEAVLISLVGGAVGLLGSVVLLQGLSSWNPFPRWPIHLSVTPDANVYGVALLLALASGFLFGAVPVRQVLLTNPYQIVKAGSNGRVGRRITARDVLLVVQKMCIRDRRLGFTLIPEGQDEAQFRVHIPSWRLDVELSLIHI